jgi:putative ABC transport system permease protein
MLKLTLRGLWSRKLRTALTFIVVMLGVSLMTGTLVLTDTIGKTFDDLFADVNRGTDVYVRGVTQFEASFGPTQRPRLDESIVDEIEAVDGVAIAQPNVQGYAQIIDKDGDPIGDPNFGPPTFGGNWATVDELNPFTIVEGGRPPEADDELVIDKRSADDADLAVGDRVRVQTQAQEGSVREYTIVGIARFGSADSPGGASFALMTLDAAKERVAQPGRIDSVSVVADEGITQTELRDRVASALGEDAEVLTGVQITEENQTDIEEGLQFFTGFLTAFAGIALVVGSFVIYNSFSILVAQRNREMALLRAVGASRRQVLTGVLLEAVIIGLLASLAGFVIGLGVTSALKALMNAFGFDLPAGGTVVTTGAFLTAVLSGFLVTVASAVVPAVRAARVSPLAAMRDVAVEQKPRILVRIVIATVIAVLGALSIYDGIAGEGGVAAVGTGVLLIFIAAVLYGPAFSRQSVTVIGAPLPAIKGVTGKLARENAARNPRRTASTATALLIGVAIIAFFLTFNSSIRASIDNVIDDQFVGDYTVTAGSGFGGSLLPLEVTDQLNDLPEVDVAAGLSGVSARIAGSETFAIGLDPDRAFELFDVAPVAGEIRDLAQPDTIAVFEGRAKDKGWSVGDVIDAQFPQHNGAAKLRIVSLYDNKELAGDYTLGTPTIDQYVPDQGEFWIFIRLADGVDAGEARAALQQVTDGYPTAELLDLEEFKEDQASQFAPILGLISVLLALTIVIAVLGIMNTLALSVLERTRELGLMRAVGGTRQQVRSVIRWESVVIALLGSTMGLALGLFFAWSIGKALEEDGFTTYQVPYGGVIVVIILSGLFGMLAALYPAWRAGRLDVLEAIHSE